MDILGSDPLIPQKRPLEQQEEEKNIKRLKPYNENMIVELVIGDNCHVSAQRFRTEEDMYIHVRYYNTSPTGKLYPSKKGIALPLDKWKQLIEDHMDDIDQALQETKKDGAKVFYKKHLGQNICHRRTRIRVGRHKKMVVTRECNKYRAYQEGNITTRIDVGIIQKGNPRTEEVKK